MDSEQESDDSEQESDIICLEVEAMVKLKGGKFHVMTQKFHGKEENNECESQKVFEFLQVEGTMYVYCKECYGNGHEGCYKSPPIKHPLHPKHTLIFVGCDEDVSARKCFCCEDSLMVMFYFCPSCDFAINLACAEKKPVLLIQEPKRHEHTLTLFPRQVTTNCNVCALDDSRCPIYICPLCDFVVHKRCINLPWVIRISRHLHRISFTSSFALGDLFCSICRRKINNDYGGYSCNKEGCSYFAHSRCATGKNVWDGKELEGEPEEVEEEFEPFVQLGDGIIRHFSHEHHHLKLDVDINRAYDENKLCEACIKPIYYGNFYSCMDCDFILHENCAKLSRRICHAIHPHPLTLQVETEFYSSCKACYYVCSSFFYKCSQKECYFALHTGCAITSEPLVHGSHTKPLFLTPEPEGLRICSICKDSGFLRCHETFNCIECDFALCFKCASLPQKVRYKHDDHILTLSYGKEKGDTKYWCEICEAEIDQEKRFYTCVEYCCVTLHIECLHGGDLHSRVGSYLAGPMKLDFLPNKRMTRPICSNCNKRCVQNIVFQRSGLNYCCHHCMSLAPSSKAQH